MRIRSTPNYFYFKLDPGDYRQFGVVGVARLVDDIKSDIPVDARNYFDDESEWQIREDYRGVFDGIVSRHFAAKDQISLF